MIGIRTLVELQTLNCLALIVSLSLPWARLIVNTACWDGWLHLLCAIHHHRPHASWPQITTCFHCRLYNSVPMSYLHIRLRRQHEGGVQGHTHMHEYAALLTDSLMGFRHFKLNFFYELFINSRSEESCSVSWKHGRRMGSEGKHLSDEVGNCKLLEWMIDEHRIVELNKLDGFGTPEQICKQ